MSRKIFNFAISFYPPSKEDGCEFWIAECPELNLVTQGETFYEASKNIKEEIELHGYRFL